MVDTKAIIGPSNPDASLFNLFGARPGAAFSYDGFMMEGVTNLVLPITSTYEGIQKVILNPVLEVDRDLPPIFFLQAVSNPKHIGFDGRLAPYHALLFQAPCKYKGVRGLSGWEYVDAFDHDKTVSGDLLVYWGWYSGMLKKLADIGYRQCGDETIITVERHRTQLINMRMRVKEEISVENNIQDMTTFDKWYFIREFPNGSFTGYSERSVWAYDFSARGPPKKSWKLEGEAEPFGQLKLDPLNLLKIEEVHFENI